MRGMGRQRPSRFLVLDTESSVCKTTHARLLVSMAYEVVVVKSGTLSVSYSRYDVVAVPAHIRLDAHSERVHGISADVRKLGRPLDAVLVDFLRTVEKHQPQAIVGHDVTGDVVLFVNEAIRAGVPVSGMHRAFRRLICTKHLTVGQCCIPLPLHLRYEYPCDVLLDRLCGGFSNDGPLFKWPNLDRVGVNYPDAHTAPMSVLACSSRRLPTVKRSCHHTMPAATYNAAAWYWAVC